MRRADTDLLTDLLRACSELSPQPLYPAAFSQEHGIDREMLDKALDELRTRGLLRLTDWVQGMGQGYTLTEAGLDYVERPRGLQAGAALPKVQAPAPHPLDDDETRTRPLFRRGPATVSMGLIAINVAVFIMGPGESRFSLIPDAVLHQHEWWRLLTYAFLHAGLLHIFFNMYFLYSLGPIVEAMWGSGRLLVLYLVSAVTGACVVIWVNRVDPQGHVVETVGASGALCGMLASLGIWVMLNREHLPPMLASSLSRNVTINLILIGIMSFTFPNVSWEGHLGGALGGAIASFPLQISRYTDSWPRRILGIVGAILVAGLFVLLALGRDWGIKPPF